MALHFLIIVISVVLAAWIRLGPQWYQPFARVMAMPLLGLALFAVVGVALFDFAGVYGFYKRWSVAGKLLDVTKGVAALFVGTLVALFFLNLDQFSRTLVAVAFILVWLGVASTTLGVRGLLVWHRYRSRWRRPTGRRRWQWHPSPQVCERPVIQSPRVGNPRNRLRWCAGRRVGIASPSWANQPVARDPGDTGDRRGSHCSPNVGLANGRVGHEGGSADKARPSAFR